MNPGPLFVWEVELATGKDMSKNLAETLSNLIEAVSHLATVRAIGLSGGERPLPEPGAGDIDLFVYCTETPTRAEREQMLSSLHGEIAFVEIGRLESGRWGEGDCFLLEGIETWLLYFTIADATAELEAILDGQYLGRLDNYYYPIGRCAMWKNMRRLYDPDGFLGSIRRRLEKYPEGLATAVLKHHLYALDDVEDLERAVQRRDVFFFHFAMDLALDHFLQTLFALNREYFPSRKRSEQSIHDFALKPPDCEQRLRQVLRLGGDSDTLEASYQIWKRLAQELKSLADRQTGEKANAT